MADEVNETSSNERPSVLAYGRWTSAVVKMVTAVELVGEGYRFGPLRVGVDSSHVIMAPLGIDPGEIPERLDHVASMVREVHDSALAAADATETVLRELGLASNPPEGARERVAMLLNFVSDLEQAISRQRWWWHPEAVGLVLRVGRDMQQGDPRIPVKVTVYI